MWLNVRRVLHHSFTPRSLSSSSYFTLLLPPNNVIRRFSTPAPTTALQPQFKLRGYQEECIQKCIDALESNKRRIAVSLPTGGGKTVVFSSLIDAVKPRGGQGDKVMILVHRKELAFQAANTCRMVHPEKSVEIEMGDHVADPDTADIVIASVQTLMRGRLEKFHADQFKLLIIDEAHHAAANSYLEIMDHFGIHESSDVPVVGFSATLRREDEKTLDTVFDEIVFHLDLEEMILNQHLSDAKFTTIRLKEIDLQEVPSRRGDFVVKSLSRAMNTDVNNELALQTYMHFLQTYNFKSTMLFGVDISHVETMCALFRANDIPAEFVTSKSKKADRARIVREFKEGKIPVLMNCGIFTEGTDMPNIDCILLVRPTQSKTLLIQMIGRGLRLHDSKEYCHIVDFVGINGANVVSTPTLRNLPSDMLLEGMSLEQMEEEKLNMEKLMKQKEFEKRLAEEEMNAIWKKAEMVKYLQNETKLNSNLAPDVNEPELDLSAFDEIELKTFNSLSDFIDDMGEDPDEIKKYGSVERFFLKKSIYPWMQGSTENIWVLSWPDRNFTNQAHLRLQVHPKGIDKEFFNEVSIGGIYNVTKPSFNVDSKVYTLALYRERSQFKHKRGSFDRYQKRYSAELVLPVTQDIRLVLSHVRKLFEIEFSFRDHTKYAKWRSDPASEKQKEAIWNGIRKVMKDDTQDKQDFVHQIISGMKKGNAGDLLTAQNIFRSIPSKRFVTRCLKKMQTN